MRLWSPLTHSTLTHNVTFNLLKGAADSKQEKDRGNARVCECKLKVVDIFICGEKAVKQETELRYIAYTPTYCRCNFYSHMLKDKVWVITTSAKAMSRTVGEGVWSFCRKFYDYFFLFPHTTLHASFLYGTE